MRGNLKNQHSHKSTMDHIIIARRTKKQLQERVAKIMAKLKKHRRKLLWHLYPSYLLITLLSLFAIGWYTSSA